MNPIRREREEKKYKIGKIIDGMIDRNEGKHARIYIQKKEIGKEIEKNTAREEKKSIQ